MDFKRRHQHVAVLVAPRSLLIMRAEARYEWTHGIARRSRDTVAGQSLMRGRRLSVTFRNVMVNRAVTEIGLEWN
jgi:alkylated DNA repair dioxygenase AlkB